MSYLIVKCPYCGDVRAIKTGFKSFQCFNCGRRVKFNVKLVLARVDDHHEVPYMVMKFKEAKIKK
ncbi:MAG: DUF1922 domain-containing protein [Candidatus Methanomethylicia archaeon]